MVVLKINIDSQGLLRAGVMCMQCLRTNDKLFIDKKYHQNLSQNLACVRTAVHRLQEHDPLIPHNYQQLAFPYSMSMTLSSRQGVELTEIYN